MRIAVAFLTLAATCLPVAAGETPWQEVAPGVRLRLISDDVVKPDRSTMVALEIDMPSSTNTYWRVPGETGIPTQFDFAGSREVSAHEVLWPYPRIETQSGYVDYVYRGPTVLPVQVQLGGEAAEVAVSVMLGICNEICVPAQAAFSLPLDFARPDRAQGLRIAQAVALTPLPWQEPGDPVTSVGFDAARQALAVRFDAARVDPASLIADGSAAGQLFGAPQKSPEADLVLLPLLGGDAGSDVEGKPVLLTFMTDTGPFSVERRITSAGSTATSR